MGWKRYWTAWSRYHHSGGFGIHSPYAYRFVRNVWHQPLPYYAYEGIHQLLDTIRGGTSRRQQREMDVIGEREARLLFRVTNFFNPRHILQVGAATGAESVAMLKVSANSRLYLFDPQLEQNALALRVLQTQLHRIECFDNISVAINDFLENSREDEAPALSLINAPIEEEMLQQLLNRETVLVMRNLRHSTAMRTLFDNCRRLMTKGQTYTNDKIAILLPHPKLQREDFSLWL